MPDLYAAVTRYLAGRHWPYEDHRDVIITPVLADERSWTAVRDDQILVVYSMVPVSVPVDRRTDAALYIARANSRLALGNFEIDLDKGEVRFRTSIDVEGTEISEPLIDHLFLANIMGVVQYLDALRLVIEGADPSEAIGVADNAAT